MQKAFIEAGPKKKKQEKYITQTTIQTKITTVKTRKQTIYIHQGGVTM